MDAGIRRQRIEGLEAIKAKALDMTNQGKTDGEIRTFIQDGTKELAFAVPDEESFIKAVRAVKKFKKGKK